MPLLIVNNPPPNSSENIALFCALSIRESRMSLKHLSTRPCNLAASKELHSILTASSLQHLQDIAKLKEIMTAFETANDINIA